MTHLGTVTLETERLTLRSFTEGDTDAMFRNWASDPEVTKFLTWKTHQSEKVTSAVLQSWVAGYEKSDNYQWAIEVKADAELIGSISVVSVRENEHTATIGYCIGRSWWRQGYTSEALSEVVRFLIADVGFNRVQACHDPRNPNSGAVMKKCGLKYEGLNRQAGKNNMPGFCDEMWYAILAEDYFADKSPLVGKTVSVTVSVGNENTAIAMKSGSLPVFATPSMVALMEQAACACLDECGVGTTVGTAMNVEHVAASPVGAEITATATITSVSGRKYEFAVSAHDGIGEVGRGTHTRVAIDADRFMKKAEGRRS